MVTRAILSLLLAMLLVSLPLRAQSDGTRQAGEQGWQALQTGEAERAASIFRQALESHPSDGVLHFGAGVAAHVLGRNDDARRALKRALELNPRLPDAAKLLGEIQYSAGDVDDAIRSYEQALAQRPGDLQMRERLDAWRKEADVHRGLTQRNDGRFSIVFEGRTESELADRAVATLDAAYWRIGRAIGAFPSNSITVTLYTEQQFRDLTRAPEWSSGIFDGRIRMPVKGARQNLNRFDRVLVHELTHAMISSLAPRGVPAWLHEGLASYFEPEDIASAIRVLRVTGPVPVEMLLEGFSRLSERQAAAAYAESLLLADVLMRRAGSRMGIVLQSLDRGQTLQDSLQLVGVGIDDLEADATKRFK
jgi:Peptidase MA superfamily/Tetratricopeptide repeat